MSNSGAAGDAAMEVDPPRNVSAFQRNLEKYDNIRLPEAQGAREQIGRRVDAKLNAFSLEVAEIGKVVYRYELVFTGHSPKKDFVFHTKGGKNDTVLKLRKDAIHKLLELFMERHGGSIVRGSSRTGKELLSKVAFDYGCAIYLIDQVGNESGVIDEADIPPAASEFIRGLTSISYTFRHVETVKTEGIDIIKRPGMQFLDVLTWAKLDRTRHLHFGNKAYYSSSSKPDAQIPGGKIVKEGMEKSIRPIGQFMAMQVDAKASPFFAHIRLIDLVKEFCDPRDIGRNKHLLKQMKNLAVETIHLPKGKQVRFEIKGISRDSAERTTFKNKDGVVVTVSSHFAEVYRKTLQFPGLPLIEQRKGDKSSFFPIEVLVVMDGQRVGNSKAEPRMIEALIKIAQKKPPALIAAINDQKYKAYLDGNSNSTMDHFKVGISDKFMSVKVEELPGPEIKYGGGRVAQPDMKFPEKWRVDRGVTFVRPAKSGGKPLYFLVFDRCLRSEDARSAASMLIKAGRERGIELDDRNMAVDECSSNFDDMSRYFDRIRGKALAVFGFTKDRNDSVHEQLKLLEQRSGIVTQHVCSRILQEVASGKPMGAGNIMMKFNQKLGGVNFNLGVSPMLREKAPQLYNDARKWFTGDRMYMGLFVSHAGPQSFADRLAGVPQSEPTVVGLSFTTLEGVKLQGAYWMQTPGEQLIMNMTPHVVNALRLYSAVCRKLPEEIVVFRNGKSEGEFKALASEMQQIIAACKSAGASMNTLFRPTITFIVLMRNSNYRMFLDGQYGPDNVRPGTILGKDGCHPHLKEFVVVCQRALMGTARPTRCTVVAEIQGDTGKVMHLDEIKAVTNALAYGSGIVTAPISVPAPFDAAEKLANRGRNNYKADLNLNDDAMSMASGGSLPGDFRNDGSADFFDRLSKKFASKLEGQAFWA